MLIRWDWTIAALFVATALTSALVLVGCGEDESGPCLNAPTFAQDMAPIADAKCIECHSPGANRRGAPPDLNFHDWPSVEPVALEFADAITSGRMPPANFLPGVTAEERDTAILWRTCGFRP